MSLSLTSTAFDAGRPIPKKHAYTGEGQNVSPPLAWTGAPAGTRSFALICDDPDAPSPQRPRPKPWVHWVLFDIPAATGGLAEGQTGVGVNGRTDFGEEAWGGPLPPPGSGTHRYFFKLYSLDTMLELKAGATKDDVLAAMMGHVLAEAEVFGTYVRK
jgi:Raf kinase inhibitor-like YbhB/YbcL family protein